MMLGMKSFSKLFEKDLLDSKYRSTSCSRQAASLAPRLIFGG